MTAFAVFSAHLGDWVVGFAERQVEIPPDLEARTPAPGTDRWVRWLAAGARILPLKWKRCERLELGDERAFVTSGPTGRNAPGSRRFLPPEEESGQAPESCATDLGEFDRRTRMEPKAPTRTDFGRLNDLG